MERPPIFLTNAASVRATRSKKRIAKPETAACVGPGDHWSIQCRPARERGELGRGVVWTLAPDPSSLDSVRRSRMDLATYRERFLNEPAFLPPGPPRADRVPRALSEFLEPGRLLGLEARGGRLVAIEPGDTLTCCCGREAAAEGACHRVWAAALLISAGWEVTLDGLVVEDPAELLARGA